MDKNQSMLFSQRVKKNFFQLWHLNCINLTNFITIKYSWGINSNVSLLCKLFISVGTFTQCHSTESLLLKKTMNEVKEARTLQVLEIQRYRLEAQPWRPVSAQHSCLQYSPASGRKQSSLTDSKSSRDGHPSAKAFLYAHISYIYCPCVI